jgi:hypothetical protein
MTEPNGAEGGFAGIAIMGIPINMMLTIVSRHDFKSERTESSKRATPVRVERSGRAVNLLLRLLCKAYP